MWAASAVAVSRSEDCSAGAKGLRGGDVIFVILSKCLEAVAKELLRSYIKSEHHQPIYLRTEDFLSAPSSIDHLPLAVVLREKPSPPFAARHRFAQSELFAPSRVPRLAETIESQQLQGHHVFHGSFRFWLESFDAPRSCSLRRCCREGMYINLTCIDSHY